MTKSTSLIYLTVVVLGLCSFTAFAGFRQQQFQQQDVVLFYNIFKDWTSQFNNHFGIEEMAVRFYNWRANYDFVQQYNTENPEIQLEMNQFAALAPEEFTALHTGLNPTLKATKPLNNLLGSTNAEEDNLDDIIDDDEEEETTTDAPTNGTLLGAVKKNATRNTTSKRFALPKSVDWRKTGAVTGVKNQGKCGGCWAFAASGALEGLHYIKNKKLVSFSDQQMIDCSALYGNQGCDGGLMTLAFQYTADYGIEPEKGYEYAAKVDKCKHNSQRVAFKNSGFKEVPANNTKALKLAVSRQPVSVGIEANSMTLQLFKSGVITADCGTQLDHGVLIVGYDKTPKGQEYWIVKNSWGPQWGLGGYFHVAIGSHNGGAGLCGINMMASYPTL